MSACAPLTRFTALVFALLLLFSVSAVAQSHRPTVKMVFPFGEGHGKTSTCSADYQTSEGCCDEDPSLIYTWSGRKGCCRSPRGFVPYSGDNICCNLCSVGMTRYGQSAGTECGYCCSAGRDFVASFGKTSCCASCLGPRNGQTAADICGTCCPSGEEGVSFSGESACCTEKPAGTVRWSQSVGNVCGQFCSTNKYVNSFGSQSCCPTACASRMQQTQTDLCGQCCSTTYEYMFPMYNSDGTPMTGTGGISGCCINEAAPKSIDGDHGTICCLPADTPFMYLSGKMYHGNGNLQAELYHPACCSYAPQSLPNNMGTYCCSPGRSAYAFLYNKNTYSQQMTDMSRESFNLGCCSTPPQSLSFNLGTYCCPTGQSAYIQRSDSSESYNYGYGAVSTSTTYYSAACCPGSVHTLPSSYGDICCSANEKFFFFSTLYYSSSSSDGLFTEYSTTSLSMGCCPNASPLISVDGNRGTFCCSSGFAYPYYGPNNLQKWMSYNSLGSLINSKLYNCCSYSAVPLPDDLGMECCPTSAAAYFSTTNYFSNGNKTKGYWASCCEPPSSVVSVGPGWGTRCCSPGLSLAYGYYASKIQYPTLEILGETIAGGCCSSNTNIRTLSDNLGTICCSTGASDYLYSIAWNSYGEASVSYQAVSYFAGCCTAGVTPITLSDGQGTYCCDNGQTAYSYYRSIGFNPDGTVGHANTSLQCCSATMSVLSLPNSWGTMCCSSQRDAFAHISEIGGAGYFSNGQVMGHYFSTGCCNAGSVAQTLPFPASGTYCCPTGTSVYSYRTQKTSTNNSYVVRRGCCTTGQASASLPFSLGTYCCPTGRDAYAFYSSTGYLEGYVGEQTPVMGCCAAGTTVQTLSSGLGTTCCPTGQNAYVFQTGVTYSVWNGSTTGSIIGVNQSASCCSPANLHSLPNNLGDICCPTAGDTYAYISIANYKADKPAGKLTRAYGCCGAGQSLMSIQDDLGTFCCSAGKSPSYTFGSSFISSDYWGPEYDRYTNITCQ